jgi:hypothetical protein
VVDNTRAQEFMDAVDAGDLERVTELSEETAGEPADEQIDVLATPGGFFAAMGGKVIVVD